MQRTTLMISPELKRKAMEAARRKTFSFGEFTRRALHEAVQRNGDRQDRDPLLADRAAFKGKTPRELAVRHDSYLYCVSFVLMKRYRITTAFTFDRHFRMAGWKSIPESP